MNRVFEKARRQPLIDQQSYLATLRWFDEDTRLVAQKLAEPTGDPRDNVAILKAFALQCWDTLRLRYTAGESLPELASYLTTVVEAYERVVDELEKVPDELYYPPFVFDDMIDNYVDYVNILATAVLLHREDLIPRIHALIEGTDYDKADVLIEGLLAFFLPERPKVENWYWKAYTPLLTALNCTTPHEQAKGMEKYVKGWYKSMKGVAHFWGKHEQIEPDFSPYMGYWAICSGAFTYLYDLDDAGYRDEMVYPKDMVDYARSLPRNQASWKEVL
ncbi:PoNe immunity protein domain-containing protein [Pseudoduganella sp.]|uniref:PoNe immunity protein domain-containing protein n=1 Tax=Pseudoduganella sp. TaxID=1880898 RepID=UPI0035AE267D